MRPTCRKPADLSESFRHRLNDYALAASAAGVSVLALALPADGKVIYTPAHLRLGARSNTFYHLDLNHDGIKDFTLSHGYNYSSTTGFLFSLVAMSPYRSNANRIAAPSAYAFALRPGAKIGPAGQFSRIGFMAVGRAIGRAGTPTYQGAWANDGKGVRDRYVGLAFTIKESTHYGWARVSISKYPFAATLSGYAYETVPGKPIIAGKTKGVDVVTPEPASLGELAAGATNSRSRK